MFGIKKSLNSEEYEKIIKKVLSLESEIGQTKARLEALNTSYNDLRGKFNRKLNILQEQQESDLEEPKSVSNLKMFSPF